MGHIYSLALLFHRIRAIFGYEHARVQKVYEGREDPNANINGPSSAVLMAHRWRVDYGPIIEFWLGSLVIL